MKSEIKAEKSVCVIGCGASGLAAIKQCLDEQLMVTCFERTGNFGGLWRYRDICVEGLGSVMKSTILNTSKEMTAFSDYLIPDCYPNFLHHSLLISYLQNYASNFQLLKFVRFNHEVISVEKSDVFAQCGSWQVTIRNIHENRIYTELFDGVLICTGHHFLPSVPFINGLSNFKGKVENVVHYCEHCLLKGEVLHSHSYKKANQYENKKIVVVGFGNSAVDVASDLVPLSDKVYLSTRSGGWIQSRIGAGGYPFDGVYNTRITRYFFSKLPRNCASKFGEWKANRRFDHKMYGVKSNRHIFSRQFIVSDLLPVYLTSGRIVMKPDIEYVTSDGVIFKGENEVTKCDVIIFATGYKLSFPFLSESLFSFENNKINLYLNMFIPGLEFPKTLAFIGLLQPVGSFLPVVEMQCRYFVQLIKGKCELPSTERMLNYIKQIRRKMEAEIDENSEIRHALRVEFIDYMDTLANEIKAKPNFLKLFFTDIKLWYHLMFRPCVAYQYRLVGPCRWSEARQAIINTKKRIKSAFSSWDNSDHPSITIHNNNVVYKK